MMAPDEVDVAATGLTVALGIMRDEAGDHVSVGVARVTVKTADDVAAE